jgi:ribosomal protein S6
MTKYEISAILPGALTDAETKPVLDRIITILQENNAAQEIQPEYIGKLKLAYPIRKMRFGHFYNIPIEFTTDAVKTINDKLLLESDILRFIIRKFNPKIKHTKPQSVTKLRDEGAVTKEIKEEQPVEWEAYVAVTPQTQQQVSAKKDINIEEIDKKLDEIMEGNIKLDI